jgi:formiminoglutamate deiminase
MRRAFHVELALLPGGWRRRVRLEVVDGRIGAIAEDVDPAPGDRREAVAIPGLPNLHSHAFQRAMAGQTERRGPGEDSFWSWRELMYRFAGRMGPDEVEAIAAYAYADMLEAGFTSVGEFHYVHRDPEGGLYDDPAQMALRHLAAAQATGIDITLLPVFYAASDFGGAAPKPGQRRFINDVESFGRIVEGARAAGIGRVGVAPHSLRAAPPDMLREIAALPGPVHIHIAEQVKEVDDCVAWSGQRPVEWLFDHMAVDDRWCLVHATHLTEGEMLAIAGSGAVAGLCPITEANLGDGLFPARAFLQAGGRFGVGSDSNVEIDAAGELRLLEYGQRLVHRARNVLATPDRASTGQRLFEDAVAGGAQALGLAQAGLAPGARADFLVLDRDQADMAASGDEALLDTWIFSTGRRALLKVVAGGEVVVEGGRHVNRAAIDARYRAAIAKLKD